MDCTILDGIHVSLLHALLLQTPLLPEVLSEHLANNYLFIKPFWYLHSKKVQMSNGWRIFWKSVCCPFAVWCIEQRMFLCTICALEHLCTNCQPNICAQTVDEYFGRPFAVRLCTNGWPIYRNEKEKKIQWKSRKYHFRRMQSIIIRKINPYIGQQTVVRCFSAQTVAWADLYPFAVRTSNVHLSVCCPNSSAV